MAGVDCGLTTPVLLSGRINDLITPEFGSIGGMTGRNGCGKSIAMGVDVSIMLATGRNGSLRLFLCNPPAPLTSNPFVSSFAAQLLAQLACL